MTSERIMIRAILSNIVAFLIFFSASAFGLYYICGDMAVVYASLLLVVPFFFLMLVRIKIKNIFVFMLFHMIFFVIPIVCVHDILIKAVLVAFLTVSAVYSITVRLNGEWKTDTGLAIVGLLVHTVLLFLSDYLGYQPLRMLLILCALLIVLCALLYTHIDNLDYSLEIMTAHSSHPVSSILFFNNVMIAIFLAIAVGAGFLSTLFPLERFMRMIGGVLLSILRFLFQFLPESSEESPPEQAADSPNNMSGMFDAPAAEPSQLLILLEKIFYYIISAALIAMIIAAICYAIYRFYKKFYSAKQTDHDVKESLIPDINVTIIKELWEGLKSLLPAFRSTPTNPYRKAYVKKINLYIKKGITINPSDTTLIIANKIRPDENIDQLTAMYEKARYGDAKKQ